MLALFSLGGGEVILIGAVMLLMFGAKKLPELARGLGLGIKEFKKATREVSEELHSAMDEHDRAPLPVAKRLPTGAVPADTEHSSSPASSSQKA
jgi:sec-independent protein translocase protein TatA